MKTIFFLCILILQGFSSAAKERTYIGSTPADPIIREFLGISLADSIDFIRWKLKLRFTDYTLECRYGISKPGTNGFIDEKKVTFTGTSQKEGIHYYLTNNSKKLNVMEINNTIIHFADSKDHLLSGNGGYSYALNSINGKPTDLFNFAANTTPLKNATIYEGRTPCSALSDAVGMGRDANCYKLKWYFIFYIDPATDKPSYYLRNGKRPIKEAMEKGTWEIIKEKDGRTIYKVNPTPENNYTLYFVKAGDNILFFTDPAGNLLVGTEDFSFTLNRKAL